MSNIKTKRNLYETFGRSNLTDCNSGKVYGPSCNKNKENFGSFSLSAAVRYPFNQSYFDPNYKLPTVPGVN